MSQTATNTTNNINIKQVNRIALLTIVRRETVRILRIWSQTLLPPVITMSLYFLIFGNLIGGRIGTMGGVPYIQYILPGLIMLTMIMNAYMNASSSFFSAKFQRCIEELLVAPISSDVIIWGYVAGSIVRASLVGLLVGLVGLFFTHISIAHLFLTLLVGLLTAVLFSLAGLVNGLFAKKFDDVGIVPTFVLTPLTYLGDVFYSTSLLHPVFQKLTLLNPIFYMVNAFRYGMLGQADIAIGPAILVICVFIILLYSTVKYLFNRGIGLKS